MTPRRRKRQLEGSNLLPRDISFETSPFDTTSIYSAPSLLSLQSIPEGLQNGAEEEIVRYNVAMNLPSRLVFCHRFL